MKPFAANDAPGVPLRAAGRTWRDWTPQNASGQILLALTLLVYLYVLLRTAWICDDAYITFRTVENFLAGYGLTWNTDERVQAYTHPLWMFLLAGVRAITGEIYYTSLFTSMALSLAAVLLLTLKIARTWGQALLAAALCAFSKAFVDFSTSGLENPLSYLLVASFLGLYLGNEGRGARGEDGEVQGTGDREQPATGARDKGPGASTPANSTGVAPGGQLKASSSTDPEPGCHGPVDAALSPRTRAMPCGRGSRVIPASANGSRLLQLSLLASLILLNRMDLALIVGPPLLQAFWQSRSLRSLGSMVLGLTPFLAWEIFSVIYYGFPFPNTAYAKLNTGIPAWRLAEQGFHYFENSLHFDPLTLPAIAASLLAAILTRGRRHLAVAVGITLYLLYIVRIGGDFMSGRFLAVPLFVAVSLLATLRLPRHAAISAAAIAAAIILGLSGPRPSILSDSHCGSDLRQWLDSYEISDERLGYYQSTGLLRTGPHTDVPSKPAAHLGIAAARAHLSVLSSTTVIGMAGYYAGPNVHIVDALALPDPLLARLPVREGYFRIGHFERFVPDGYIEGLRSGRNELTDLRLRQFHDPLRLVTSGPLFTRDRWKAILDLNLGRSRHLVDAEYYRHPPARLPMSLYARKDDPGTADLNLRLPSVGAWVLLGQPCHASRIEIALDRPRACRILYPQGLAEPVEQAIPADPSGSPAQTVQVPEPVSRTGFDRLLILPAPGDDACYVGTIRIFEAAP